MTATKTATMEAERPSEMINDLVHEAMLSYERALKSGLQLQEDSVKLWRDLLARKESREQLREALDSLSAEVYPNLRKQLAQLVESSSLSLMLLNRTGSQMLDLLAKAAGVYQAASLADAQRCMQDLLDSSLAVVRENVPAFVTANVRIIRSWKGLAELNPVKNVFAGAQPFRPERAA